MVRCRWRPDFTSHVVEGSFQLQLTLQGGMARRFSDFSTVAKLRLSTKHDVRIHFIPVIHWPLLGARGCIGRESDHGGC
jgi:hypothetical protein